MKFIQDERMQALSGRLAAIFLGLTQVALLGAILYRRYALGQHEDAYMDIRVILMLSVFGYIAARLYLGALLPVFSVRTLLTIYLGFVAGLFIILSLWLGLPTLDNWHNTILPVVVGPAILVGLFWLFSWLGNKRVQ
jgi:hypothetical protein